jgi:hypothetical protein
MAIMLIDIWIYILTFETTGIPGRASEGDRYGPVISIC